MKKIISFSLVVFETVLLFAQGTPTNGVLASLCAPYQAIQTLSTEVRRTTTISEEPVQTMLSTVVFARPDCFYSETVTPLHRKVIADGTMLRMYIKGRPNGAEVAITNIVARKDTVLLSSFRAIPASPMDMLLICEGAKEFLLSDSSEKKTKIGLQHSTSYAELTLDEMKRVSVVSIYDSREKKQENLRVEYSNFKEVMPHVWLALTQKTIAVMSPEKREKVTDTVRFVNLVVNEPVDESRFAFDSFFDGVTFEPLYR